MPEIITSEECRHRCRLAADALRASIAGRPVTPQMIAILATLDEGRLVDEI